MSSVLYDADLMEKMCQARIDSIVEELAIAKGMDTNDVREMIGAVGAPAVDFLLDRIDKYVEGTDKQKLGVLHAVLIALGFAGYVQDSVSVVDTTMGAYESWFDEDDDEIVLDN